MSARDVLLRPAPDCCCCHSILRQRLTPVGAECSLATCRLIHHEALFMNKLELFRERRRALHRWTQCNPPLLAEWDEYGRPRGGRERAATHQEAPTTTQSSRVQGAAQPCHVRASSALPPKRGPPEVVAAASVPLISRASGSFPLPSPPEAPALQRIPPAPPPSVSAKGTLNCTPPFGLMGKRSGQQPSARCSRDFATAHASPTQMRGDVSTMHPQRFVLNPCLVLHLVHFRVPGNGGSRDNKRDKTMMHCNT